MHDATSLTELHGNLIAGFEMISRNSYLMSCGIKHRVVAVFENLFVFFPNFGVSRTLRVTRIHEQPDLVELFRIPHTRMKL